MNLKQYLTLMCIGTALCWAMFLLVIFNMSPENGVIALIFFYSSLFLSLIGTLSIIGLSIRVMLIKKRVIFREVKNSFRQAFLFGILIISILFLQSKNIEYVFYHDLCHLGIYSQTHFFVKKMLI